MKKLILIATMGLISVQTAIADTSEIAITMINNRPATFISINNSEPMLVLVDTGFGGSLMLTDTTAKTLNLNHIRTRTVNNMGMGEITLEDYGRTIVKIGEVDVPFETITADKNLSRMLSLSGTDKDGNAPMGILSAWAISKGTISFNLSDNKIILDTSEALDASNPSVIPYAVGAGLPNFEIFINGKGYTTHLDSGSPAEIIMPARFMPDFQYMEEPILRGGAETVGRSHKMWSAQIKGDVQIGNIKSSNPKVLFIEGIPAMNVGLKLFGRGSVKIDSTNHLMQFNQILD